MTNNYSKKLIDFMAKVEEETGRKISIQTTNQLGLSGMAAYFTEDPIFILVYISPSLLQENELEQTIAHEITHGLLTYSKKYCKPKPKHQLTQLESDSINILLTMIEDIVVNKI